VSERRRRGDERARRARTILSGAPFFLNHQVHVFPPFFGPEPRFKGEFGQNPFSHRGKQAESRVRDSPRMFLKVLASIVIAFFAILWSTGNDLNSLKVGLTHWADGNAASSTGRENASDWGTS
jgi:hypothetical protein